MDSDCIVEEHLRAPLIKIVSVTACKLRLLESLMPEKPTQDEIDLIEQGDAIGVEILKELSLRKLHSDVFFVENLFLRLLKELKDNNSFYGLKDEVEAARAAQNKKAEYIAMYQAQKWKLKQSQKSNCLQSLRRELKFYQHETVLHLKEKENELKEAKKRLAQIQARTPNWNSSEKKMAEVQKENVQLHLMNEEEDYERRIQLLECQEPRERRVHSSMMSFLSFTLVERSELLEEWREKSKKGFIEERENLSSLQLRLKEKQAELFLLEKKYKEYQEIAEEYKRQKQEEEEQIQRDKKILYAIIKIQSWWKGHLVRQELAFGLKKKPKQQKPKKINKK